MGLEKLDLKNLNFSTGLLAFGIFGFAASLYNDNTIGLKISLTTFVFGLISRVIVVFNKAYGGKASEVVVWLIFLAVYILLIYRIFNFL